MANIKPYTTTGTTDAFSAAQKGGHVPQSLTLGQVDSAGPVLENLTPADGEPLPRDTFVEFDVYDIAPGLRLVEVLASFVNDEDELVERDEVVVYRDGAFRGRWALYGVVTGAGTIDEPYHFKIKPAGGWPQNGRRAKIFPRYIDAAGNELEVG